ncbi:hypothetical protein ColTof4_04003 [Colletotrichum tofieldiae]|nr:hypothetical protein ColTof3_13850 [Colletotrichum tofieldiae]GKT71580.1 hypothetical protein ColTof4_04003 [Colletotrichum tofieldiae]GKT95258.1 hypothetical protein Ct61P_13108 [Colletotrichum tofieldiae]
MVVELTNGGKGKEDFEAVLEILVAGSLERATVDEVVANTVPDGNVGTPVAENVFAVVLFGH